MKSEARLFLEAFFAGKPDDLYVLHWTLEDKKSRWFRDTEEAIQFAERECNQDLYVGVGFSGEAYGDYARCRSHQIVGIRGLWADFDLKSDAHKKSNLPATLEEALELLPREFPPTFIILTGNGVHAWWLFREPLIFRSDEERESAVSLANRWQSFFQLIASSRGWAFDRLADLARLLRIPGTQNCKDPRNLKPVRTLTQTDHRYNPSDFLEFLDNQSIPSEEDRVRKEKALKQAFTDADLVLDKNAAIPPEMLNHFLETDAKFRLTWSKQRQDLPDKSRSGYDFALANFGARNGLSEQQTADLIFEHRRVNGDQQRNTQAYFKLTIGKAFKERAMLELTAQEPSAPAGEPASAIERAQICQQISNILGIQVVRIVKVAGQEPTYRMELGSVSVILPGVEYLITQRKIQMKIASAADHLIPGMKPGRWTLLVKMMFAALTVEDGGDEADAIGAARIYVDTYLRESHLIDTETEPPYQTQYLPCIYKGCIAISAGNLRQHINKSGDEHFPINHVTAKLSLLGAKSVRLRGTKLRDQTRWLLPTADFPPQGYFPGHGEQGDA